MMYPKLRVPFQQHLVPVVICLAAALALRLPAVLVDSPSLGGDEADYHGLAVRLAGGLGFVDAAGQPTAWRTPGLPLVLAAVYGALGEDVALARALLVGVSSMTTGAVYALAWLVAQTRSAALLAGLLWAALPTSRALAGALLGEPLAALLVTLALAAIVIAGTRGSPVLALLAGGAMGCALLTRVYLALALVGPVVWLARGRRLQYALLFLLPSIVLLGAWAARNWVELGVPALSTQTLELWQGNNAWARGSWPGEVSSQLAYLEQQHPGLTAMEEAQRARVFIEEAVAEVLGHPSRFAWLLPRKALIFFSPASYLGFDWLYAGLAPFALIGAAGLALDRQRRPLLWILGFPVVSVLFVCLLTFGDPRFRHPVDPTIVVLAVLGLRNVLQSLPLLRRLAAARSEASPGSAEAVTQAQVSKAKQS